jgi:cilia- and flagella-associated protein 57
LINASTQLANQSESSTEKPIHQIENHDVSSIVPYSKGFIAACGHGQGFLFEKSDNDKELFRKVRELKIPLDQFSTDPSRSQHQRITSMFVSPNEETLLAVTEWQQIYQLIFSNIDVAKVNV